MNLVTYFCKSFSQPTTSSSHFNCHGVLLNKNTIEEFKATDKNDLIKRISDGYIHQLFSKDKLDNSSEIFFFILFSYAVCMFMIPS